MKLTSVFAIAMLYVGLYQQLAFGQACSQGPSFAQFQSCISATGTYSTCGLAPGSYTITQSGLPRTGIGGPTLTISRSNISITGCGSVPTGTTLQRCGAACPAGTAPPQIIMSVASNITGIEISNLAFDGNKSQVIYSQPDSDLTVFTTGNVTVNECTFENGVSFSMLTGIGNNGTNLIINSTFQNGLVSGIYARGNTTVVNSTFENFGGAAIDIVAPNIVLRQNYFFNNQTIAAPGAPYGGSGGQVGVFLGTSGNVTVATNTFDGNRQYGSGGSNQGSSGFEGHGPGPFYIYNNQVQNHMGYGYYFDGVTQELVVTGYDPGSSTHVPAYVSDNRFEGASIDNYSGGYPTGTVYLDAARFTNNGFGGGLGNWPVEPGIYVNPTRSGSISVNWVQGLLHQSCLSGNAQGPVLPSASNAFVDYLNTSNFALSGC